MLFRSGDPARRLGPFAQDTADPDGGGLFNYLNSSKQCITLNLRSPTGRQLLLELLANFDAVVDSFRSDFLASVGLSHAALRSANPDILHLSITNYGLTGPRREWEMSEITAQAVSGLMSITGDPDKEPLKIAGNQAQFIAGLHGAVALTGAILGRQRGYTAGGHIDISIFECMVEILGETITDFSYTGRVRQRQGNRQSSNHPFTILPCADGYVGVTVLDDRQWARMLDMVDIAELRDERFATTSSRREHADELDQLLNRWLGERSGEEIFLEAQERRIPFGKISELTELQDDPQYLARDFFGNSQLANGDTRVMLNSPWLINGERVTSGPAPRLGQNNWEVFSGLGLDQGDLARLTAAEVI